MFEGIVKNGDGNNVSTDSVELATIQIEATIVAEIDRRNNNTQINECNDNAAYSNPIGNTATFEQTYFLPIDIFCEYEHNILRLRYD